MHYITEQMNVDEVQSNQLKQQEDHATAEREARRQHARSVLFRDHEEMLPQQRQESAPIRDHTYARPKVPTGSASAGKHLFQHHGQPQTKYCQGSLVT